MKGLIALAVLLAASISPAQIASGQSRSQGSPESMPKPLQVSSLSLLELPSIWHTSVFSGFGSTHPAAGAGQPREAQEAEHALTVWS